MTSLINNSDGGLEIKPDNSGRLIDVYPGEKGGIHIYTEGPEYNDGYGYDAKDYVGMDLSLEDTIELRNYLDAIIEQQDKGAD